MKTMILAGLIFAATACGGGSKPMASMPTGGGGGAVGSLSVRNDSKYSIDQVLLSPTTTDDWGADLLGADELLVNGETIQIDVSSCDAQYDLKLVNEKGVACVVENVDLCDKDMQWSFDDQDLASCETAWAGGSDDD